MNDILNLIGQKYGKLLIIKELASSWELEYKSNATV